MGSFKGFRSGKGRNTSLPAQFFSELLSPIDNLGELKLTLYVFWRLDHMEGSFRYLKRTDFQEDAQFMQGLAPDSRQAEIALDEALERAEGRGTLLVTELPEGGEKFYFLNSPRGRAAMEAIRRGTWHPKEIAQIPLSLASERPNIYRLYEENIGPLTPMIADMLLDAEKSYPADWVEEAVRIAIANNVRRWKYVDAILKSWKEKGRYEQDRGDTEKDRRRYIEGEFADYVEH